MEIGCGTGIVSINLAKKGWQVEALDINPYAVISTKENIIRAGVDGLVFTKEGGLGEQGFRISEDVKLLVWNLPYLPPPGENELRLEWIEEASMSDLNEKGWGHLLVEYLEKNIKKIDPELLIILVQRKYPASPSKTSDWSDLGWSHRILDSCWLFEEKLEVVAYWKPGLGVSVKKLVECDSTMDEAKKLEIKRLSIETGAGDFFKPARILFNNCGFKACSPFAHYKEDLNSLYLTKLLDNN